MDHEERTSIRKDFRAIVNLSPVELARWLETDESRSVADVASGDDGRRSGRRALAILRTTAADLTDADHEVMRRIVDDVHRRLDQRPDDLVAGVWWRWSLLNRGHDPRRGRRPAAVGCPPWDADRISPTPGGPPSTRRGHRSSPAAWASAPS